MTTDIEQFYLFKQPNYVYGGKGSLDETFYTYFIDAASSEDEYVESIYHYMDTEYGEEWRDNPLDYDLYPSDPEEYGYDPYQGLDGYVRTIAPFDDVVFIGAISEEEIETLRKFKIL